jgi:hypothetical protein
MLLAVSVTLLPAVTGLARILQPVYASGDAEMAGAEANVDDLVKAWAQAGKSRAYDTSRKIRRRRAPQLPGQEVPDGP